MNLRTILAGLLLSCGFLSAQAQTGPHIGVISGYNSTWVLDSKLFDDQNYDSRSTWNSAPFGFVLGYKINKSSSFQAEIFKANMGAEYDILGRDSFLPDEDKQIVGEKRIETQYWSLPILYKLTTGDKVRFNFHFGPQFNFLTEGTEVNTFTEDAILKAGLSSTDLTTEDANKNQTTPPNAEFAFYKAGTTDTRATKDDFNKTDIGAAMGLGLEADIVNNLYFSANLRVFYGFKDIRSDEQVDEAKASGYYDSRNNVTGGFQLGLHYRFDL